MNKKPQEIFAAEHLSSRFHQYQKDTSKKGRSLYLSQLMQHLKRDFPEFKDHLDIAITKIRAAGSMSDETLDAVVIKAMRCHAATVEEIAEDCDLSTVDVRSSLKRMERAGKVVKGLHPASESYRDQLYFEKKD